MRIRSRDITLLVLAAVLVCGVLVVQVASGGGSFTPTATASPCVHRTVRPASGGIDGLGERLVLLGLDGAACRLGVSREALTLQLAQTERPTNAQIAALHAGLLGAVTRMRADGTLPKASSLTDEALDNSNLNFLVKAAIRALPDSVIDAALKTDDVLRRTIDELDLRKLMSTLHDPGELTREINSAVSDAVKASLLARLRSLI